jgi:hypothetical protein
LLLPGFVFEEKKKKQWLLMELILIENVQCLGSHGFRNIFGS